MTDILADAHQRRQRLTETLNALAARHPDCATEVDAIKTDIQALGVTIKKLKQSVDTAEREMRSALFD